MQLIDLTLTNTITGQEFNYSVQVNSWPHFYYRLSLIMEQLAIIENVNPNNITHIITGTALAA
jgi:hypothetical protein